MATRARRVCWAPGRGDARVAVVGADVRVYALREDSDVFDTVATLADANAAHCRAAAWGRDATLALGMSFGRVCLATFADGSADVVAEFSPRHARACAAVAFAPGDAALLAAGYDKVRAEPCLVVWDIDRQAPPTHQFGAGEPVASLAWLGPRVVAAGMAPRHLRVFDLRAGADTSQLTATTRAVLGVVADPHHEHRLASHAEDGTVKVWDMRMPAAAVLSLADAPVAHLAWAPARANVLAASYRDQAGVRLYHLAQVDDVLGVFRSKHAAAPSPQGTTVFDWCGARDATLAMARVPGPNDPPHVSPLALVRVPETPQLAWNPNGCVAVASGSVVRFEPPAEEDIGVAMHARALAGYGMTAHDAAPASARGLWAWMRRQPAVAQQGYVGIQHVLRRQQQDGSVREPLGKLATRYTSPARILALRMCGWEETDVDADLARLERSGAYEKAALWAFLHADMNRAIQALLNSRDEKLHLVSAALAGYTPDPSPAWVHMCRSLSQELTRPSLRAIFTYLSTFDWVAVTFEDMDLEEKLLVALRYFTDAQLREYVDTAAQVAVREGDLAGVVFTGLVTPEGQTLLRNYVDGTGDVQTAALAVAHLDSDSQNGIWIDAYRDFLDRQRLWHQRAQFDVARAHHASIAPAPQVHVRCSFCNQSVSSAVFLPGVKDREGRRVALGLAARSTKPAACPNCRKPLPRCALCLLPLGAMGNGFDAWFTWCVQCRHGGHARHLLEWFESNDTCPVAECDCQCSAL